MAKRKIDAAMILAAGDDAHLQTNSKVSQEKLLDGESFLELDIDSIENNPMQPRIHISNDELDELARSIKLHGLIQPIAVIKVEQDKFILKAGQRRLFAHKKLGLNKIKAIVENREISGKNLDEKALFEIAIMENTHRERLDPLEFSLSLKQAMDKKLYKNMEELAIVLSKSKSYLSKAMKVLQLDDEIIQDLSKRKLTNDIEALYEIQKIENRDKQIATYFDFINKKINRNDIRQMNKKEVSQEKLPYVFKENKQSIKLDVNIRKLTKNEKNDFKNELKALVEKYIS